MDFYIKIALGVMGCTSVIIGVCSKTFDNGPKKRLTVFGWAAITCALVACLLGAYSEMLRVRKDAAASLEKVKIEQAMTSLRDELKENEAINAIHMSKADVANKELEKLRSNLESLESKVQDPAVKSMIRDVRKTIKVDNTELTGKLSDVSKTLIGLKDSLDKTSVALAGVNSDMKAVRDGINDVHGDIESTRALMIALKAEMESVRIVKPDASPDALLEAETSEIAGVLDADIQ